MNVLISVDNNYLKYTGEFLYSLCRNTIEHLDVYLMNIEIPASKIERLRRSLRKYSVTIHDIKVNLSEKLPGLPEESYWSIEIYFRCFAQFILPEALDRILYLDVDMVAKHSIGEFYHQDFEDNYYVVCQDGTDVQGGCVYRKKKIGIDENSIYFNSGVLLINLEKLRSETRQSKILESLIEHYQTFEYYDQDLLNYLYHDKVKIEDWYVYNYQKLDFEECPAEQLKRASIIHYTGKRKPWAWIVVANKQEKYYWKNRVSYRKYDIFICEMKLFSHFLCYIVRRVKNRGKV